MSYNLYRAIILGTTLFLRTTQAHISSNQNTVWAGRDLKPQNSSPGIAGTPQAAQGPQALGVSSGPSLALSQQAPSAPEEVLSSERF